MFYHFSDFFPAADLKIFVGNSVKGGNLCAHHTGEIGIGLMLNCGRILHGRIVTIEFYEIGSNPFLTDKPGMNSSNVIVYGEINRKFT